jgi:hypothetical protein
MNDHIGISAFDWGRYRRIHKAAGDPVKTHGHSSHAVPLTVDLEQRQENARNSIIEAAHYLRATFVNRGRSEMTSINGPVPAES